jgi:hypothetical protein
MDYGVHASALRPSASHANLKTVCQGLFADANVQKRVIPSKAPKVRRRGTASIFPIRSTLYGLEHEKARILIPQVGEFFDRLESSREVKSSRCFVSGVWAAWPDGLDGKVAMT